MLKTLFVATLLGGLVGVAPLAQAEDKPAKPKATPEERFKKLDTDGDGKVSKDEFTAKAKDKDKAAARFAKMDKNSDGSLTLDELTPKPKKPKK